MNKGEVYVEKIKAYDGYRGEPIWKQPENDSTYYDFEVDMQCRVPLKSREALLKKLGIEEGSERE